MNLHEYQGKQLFAQYGLPVSKGIACETAAEAVAAAKEIGGDEWVVKAQVHAGGRGKAGGVKLVKTSEEIDEFARKWLGNNLVALAVVVGIAAFILADARIRTVLFLASTAYLLYLALRIALAGSRIAFIESRAAPGMWNGIALQLINPKAYAVNTTLFSGFTLIGGGLVAETVLKFLIMNAIWFPIHVLWLYLGIRLRQLNLSERAHRIINIAMSLSMLAVVALAFGAFLFDLNGD